MKIVRATKRIEDVDPFPIEKGYALEVLEDQGDMVLVAHGEWQVLLSADEFDYVREKPDIQTIHDSYMNGQRKQMADQITEYGADIFFPEYRRWLFDNVHSDIELRYVYFTDITCHYHYWHNVGIVDNR